MLGRSLPLLGSLVAMGGILLLGLTLRPSAVAGTLAAPPAPQLTTTQSDASQLCPPPTPELLAVEPIAAPLTKALSQDVTVRIGNGRLVQVVSEIGVAEATATAGVAVVSVPLRLGSTLTFEVIAEVYVDQGPGGCIYNYTLKTERDRNGAPLAVAQIGEGVWLPLVRR